MRLGKQIARWCACALTGVMLLSAGITAISGTALSDEKAGIITEINTEDLVLQKQGFGLIKPKATVVARGNRSRTASGSNVNETTGPMAKPAREYLGGSKVTLVSNNTASQMMSILVETNNGSVIVIDGGLKEDADHLLDLIKQKGGTVAAWFITHPHSDHIGALDEILRNRKSEITIENVYYSFAELDWYYANEPHRADMVRDIMGSLQRLAPEKHHSNLQKGDTFYIDNVQVTVMNSIYQFEHNAINNSSISFMFNINGTKMLILGDMGREAGERFTAENAPEELKCDILQLAHHGQYGLTEEQYQPMQPDICLWASPGWLYNNNTGVGKGSGSWATLETRQWMENMGVKFNFYLDGGDKVIR